MPLFICKIGAPDGAILQHELEAADESQVRSALIAQGYHVFEIRRQGIMLPSVTLRRKHRVDNRELIAFNQELVVLLKAGMPVVPVLDSILEQRTGSDGTLSRVLPQIRDAVKGGAQLSSALEQHGKLFSPLYIASVRAGEHTGDLPHTIRRYTGFLKRADDLRKKVISALVYPSILVVVAILAIALLLVYVVPTFSQVYADSGSALPLITRLLINFTRSLQATALFWIPGIIVAAWSAGLWRRSPGGQKKVDGWKLALPVAGSIFFFYSAAGFARTLATLLGSGIPLVEALRMAQGTLNNRVLEQGMLAAIHQVEEGGRLSVAFERHRLMPPLALRMLAVGETTGSLEEMLNDIAEHLEETIEGRMKLVTTAIEPVVMIGMGLVIGVIIIAMYLPIFKLAGTVG